jgi:NMD protein affecting ribosome stability and mRNA decay
MPNFCPACGATDKDFYKGFCIACYLRRNRLFDAPKKLAITRCRKCGRWLVRKRWVEDSFRTLADIAKEKVRTSLYAPHFDVDMDGDTLKVGVTGYLDPKKLLKVMHGKPEAFRDTSEKRSFSAGTQEARIRLEFTDRVCESCAKFANKYFEVKIQLRRAETFDAQRFREAEGFVRNRVRGIAARDERARAFWSEESRDGIDFFFGFRQVGDAVYGELLDAFDKPEHETSSQFLGFTKEGKKKVRFTHCVRV